MGRRSTKTTKAGKFMNPTDQYRKEQRKKELKKNKKQRQIVREAVLRMKDVGQMLKEIEDIEEQELKYFGQLQHNEKGLEEKKSKLHASVHRVARYYQQEDPKKAQELKLMIMESEQRRREMSRIYNSYTAARSKYSIEDIPMPDSLEGGLTDIPMPSAAGLSEEQSAQVSSSFLTAPPPPPGPPPPDLVEYNVIETSIAKSVRFAEHSEQVEDDPEDVSSEHSSEAEEDENQDDDDDDTLREAKDVEVNLKPSSQPLPPTQPPALPGVPPPAPPGPPPLLAQTFPPRFGMPPGPPPGPPPRFGAMPRPLMGGTQIHSQAVVSAPPKSIQPGPMNSQPVSAVISAQPQLRNMTAEVTKFMPTSLRVRRDQPKVTKPKLKLGQESTQQVSGRGIGSGGAQVQGDAYNTFMQEMQGLL